MKGQLLFILFFLIVLIITNLVVNKPTGDEHRISIGLIVIFIIGLINLKNENIRI